MMYVQKQGLQKHNITFRSQTPTGVVPVDFCSQTQTRTSHINLPTTAF